MCNCNCSCKCKSDRPICNWRHCTFEKYHIGNHSWFEESNESIKERGARIAEQLGIDDRDDQ